MATHKTRGIVLSTIKYGETSVITHIYTELFGIQHYIVKGVRKSGRQGSKQVYFQPGANLDLIVQHNSLKELQFLKEYEWHNIFDGIFSEVKRNAIAAYCAELLDSLIREPESDPDFYENLELLFQGINHWENTALANVPVYFTLQILKKMGVSFQGKYDFENFNVLDLVEGIYTSKIPLHPLYLKDTQAAFVHDLLQDPHWQLITSSGSNRNMILKLLQEYLKIHIDNYKKIKSLFILETIFY